MALISTSPAARRDSLRGAQVQRYCFQRTLLWGAALSALQAQNSQWHEADLSGSRLQQVQLHGGPPERCPAAGPASEPFVLQPSRPQA